MATETFVCPHCRARFQHSRPDSSAPHLRCPECGQPFRVAGKASPVPVVPDLLTGPGPLRREPLWPWLGGATAIALVAIVGLLAFLSWSSPPPAKQVALVRPPASPPAPPSPAPPSPTASVPVVPGFPILNPPSPYPPPRSRSAGEGKGPAPEVPSLPAGNKYALLVGVRHYSHGGLPDLLYTENDVEELDVLLKKGGYQTTVLTTTRGDKVDAARPTVANIRGKLKDILDKANKEDLVLVGLAGHGISARIEFAGKATDESFFCPADARLSSNKDVKELSKTLLGFNELFSELKESGAGIKLLLIDACRDDPSVGRNVDLDTLPPLPRGTAALFSCTRGQRAFETSELKHGVFFHFVLRGLGGEARNEVGEVTWLRLADYVISRVPHEVQDKIGGGARQRPGHLTAEEVGSPVLLAAKTVSPEAESLYRLGMNAFYGRGRKVDAAEGVAYFRRAAAKDHVLAQAALGMCLEAGSGVPRDPGEARKWSRKAVEGVKTAASAGDVEAQSLLGDMYADGRAVEKDEEKAVDWYRKAAEGKLAIAQNNLGNMYADGRGVKKNEEEAVSWYSKAADQKLAVAQCNLGLMYAKGRGVKKDDEEAEKWLHLAAEQGEPEAGNQLGLLYADGRGKKKDDQDAEEWITLGAENGLAPCQRHLGWMCFNGIGMGRDNREAARWYRKAANQGDGVAQNKFGEMCAKGLGTERDAREAGHMFRLAAEQGNRDGQVNLGDFCARGMAGRPNRTEAAYWYWKADLQGHTGAVKRWREVFHLLDGCPLQPINPKGKPNRCLLSGLACTACHAAIPGQN